MHLHSTLDHAGNASKPPMPPGFKAEALLVDRAGVQVLRARLGEESVHLRLDRSPRGAEALAELAVLATLKHPGIAPMVAFGALRGGGTYLARKWIVGEDFGAWSENLSHQKGKRQEAIGRVVAAICPALACLHAAGFVHGDIKPENFIINQDGEPVLTDFGLSSRRPGEPRLTDIDTEARDPSEGKGDQAGASGTLFALAPELLQSAQPSPATDLFALGVLLHQLLVRKRLNARGFYGRFPKSSYLDAAGSQPEDLPHWSRDVVVALLARDPERRPRSATEVGQILSGRLGLELQALPQLPPAWPMGIGRERWLKKWIESHLLTSEQAPHLDGEAWDKAPCWMRLPLDEDLTGFAETLRVNVALHGKQGELVLLQDRTASLKTTRSITAWAHALVEQSPSWVLLVLEDHKHSQQRALDALLLARAASGGNFPLVVIAQHPAPIDPGHPWLTEEVPRVDRESIKRYLTKLLPEEDGSRVETFARDLHVASAGVAATLDALLRTLTERGWLRSAAHGFRLRKGPTPDLSELAGEELEAAEIKELDSDELRILARVCVAGGTEQLQRFHAIEEHEEGNAKAIASLVTRGLLRMTAGPDHTLLRLVAPGVRKGLPKDVLRHAHAWRVECLAQDSSDSDEVIQHRLALDPSVHNQEALCDNCEALRESGHAEKALDHIASTLAAVRDLGIEAVSDQRAKLPGLFLERAKAWIELGWHDRALTELELLEPVLDQAWTARAWLVRARIARTREDTQGALRCLEKATELAPEAAVEIQVFRIQMLHSMGQDAEVRRAFRELFRDGAAPLPERQRNYLASIDAVSAYRLGAVEEAERLTRALILDVQASGDQNREAGLLVNLSTIARRTGQHGQALEALEKARALYDELGDAAGIALAGANLGQLLRDDGQLTRAAEVLRDALTMREGLGDTEGAATLRGILGLTLAERGHARAAIETLGKARASLSGAHKARFVPLLAARERELLARIGDFEGARSESLLSSSTTPDPRVLLSAAKTSFLCGEKDTAIELGLRALDLARSLSLEPNIQAAAQLLRMISKDRHWGAPDARADRLTREAAQVFSILAYPPAKFDHEEARQFAKSLGARGRDDLAARLWFALVARAADLSHAQQDLEQAHKHLALCGAGLTESETRHLRRSLLGIPDPWGGDLVPRPQPKSTEDELEMRALDLLEINHQLLRQDDLGALLPQIVEKALAVTGAERGFLVLEEDGELRQETALDSLHGDMAEPERELSRSVVQEALARMETICVSNAVNDPLLGGATSVISLELRSILCAPFVVEERLRGVIYVDHRLRTGAFGEGAERLCKLLADQAALAILQVRRRDRIVELNHELERKVAVQTEDLLSAQLKATESDRADPEHGILGESKVIVSVRALLRRAAATDIAVLLQGESGTGKDLAAKALHELSPRKSKAFVAENCAALPASLIEAELFGYVKGAFTGADGEREGLIERANGGTLFLDEVGEMSLELQSKLLRVLEQREVRRLGEAKPRPVDFRLVVATNRELETEIQAGRFREDLYYRLNGISIRMPRLEEHLEDVPTLVNHFLRLESAKTGEPRTMTRAVMSSLCRRPWPGNVRELRNEIARLCVLSPHHICDPNLIRPAASAAPDCASDGAAGDLFGTSIVPMRDIEKRAILHALASTGGDKSLAAKRLGLSRGTIYSRLKEYRLKEE